jgi:hypothetical protein
MGRNPKSPEGPRSPVTIRLPRDHVEFLDEIGAKKKMSRSDVVIAFITNSSTWRNKRKP